MFRTSFSRPGRYLWSSTATRRVANSLIYKQPRQPIFQFDSRTTRVCYSTTPSLFRKYESHHDHVNINKSTPSSAALGTDIIHEDFVDHSQGNNLSRDGDFMIGNEGIETIDPKDFPELYPDDNIVEGLNQESHPDDELAFKDLDDKTASVLLSDKERSEEEFSWFVDESYPEGSIQDKDSQSSSSSSDFVPLWQKNAQRSQDVSEETLDAQHTASSIPELVTLIESERAKNVKVIDMRDKCDWTDWMIIAEGLSERHLGNVADEVYSALKKSSPKTSPPVMEGRDTTDWVVIDAGSVVIHFMTPEARKERDLEGLWASVKNPLKMKDVQDISWDDVKGKMTKSWKEDPGRSKGEDGKRGRRGERDIPLAEVVK
ncbi:hypothetical protein BGZ46_000873, partial [Entomortierella lignicola]